MSKFLFLLAFLFVPAIGGSNGQLLKTLLLAVATVAWMRFRVQSRDKGVILILGAVVLGIAFIATLFSPVTTLFEGFIGSAARPEGWLSIAIVFLFCWFAFWNPREVFDAEDDYRVSVFDILNATYSVFICVVVVIYTFWGWEGLLPTVGTKIGVATLLAMTAPFCLAWGLRLEARSIESVASAATVFISAILIAQSECRSAMLAIGIGCTWVLVSGFNGIIKRTWIAVGVLVLGLIALLVGIVWFNPGILGRFQSISLNSFGTGPRSQLVHQAWSHGIYPFGWGLESQQFLIDRSVNDLMAFGIYDRFHVWFVDLAVTVGWVGLGVCLIAIYKIARFVWEYRDEWHVTGFAATLIAFLTCSTWNPPCLQFYVIAGISVSGMLLGYYHTRVPNRREHVAFFFGSWTVGATTIILFLGLIAGDCLNEWAKRDWQAQKELPHVMLGRQALATKLNPWVLTDYVRYYYVAAKVKSMIEPAGGKKILRDLQNSPRRHSSLEALIYIGMGDMTAAEKAYQTARWEANVSANWIPTND